MTRPRVEAVWLVQTQLDGTCSRPKGNRHHYGMQELRELLDFIYEEKPVRLEEMLRYADSRGSLELH